MNEDMLKDTMARGLTRTVRTPTGRLALLRPIAERLLKEGVISGELDGDLHAADAAAVKAALMVSAICDFCSTPGATHYHDVPDQTIMLDSATGSMGAGRSVGGWMACDECEALIAAGKRKELAERAIQQHAFPKFSRRAIEELQAGFWTLHEQREEAKGIAAGVRVFVNDESPDVHPVPAMTDRDKRIEAVMRLTGLTRKQVLAAVKGDIDKDAVAKLVAWRRQFGKTDPRTVMDLLADTGPRKPLADVTPHWQRALDMRFGALRLLQEALAKGSRGIHTSPDAVDLHDREAVLRHVRRAQAETGLSELNFDADAKLLKAAETYSFNAETVAAIREAAQSIPHDAPLSSVETPNTGAGWFWFAEPLPVASSPLAADRTHALLWGWTERVRKKIVLNEQAQRRLTPEDREWLSGVMAQHANGLRDLEEPVVALLADVLRRANFTREDFDRSMSIADDVQPALTFSAYVLDETGRVFDRAQPCPSTRWIWPLHLSFHDMLAEVREEHRRLYGPGGKFEHVEHKMGEEAILQCVAELSLFFVMACLWFKQTVPVLTREPGHVERHARKRYVKEHALKEPPSVQVVALRRSARSEPSPADGPRAEGARNYGCRWIVRGHPRLQACGPGRKDRKLIWVEAHVAGPDDKPLRTREKVYAVIR